jgi:hypothetical protein
MFKVYATVNRTSHKANRNHLVSHCDFSYLFIFYICNNLREATEINCNFYFTETCITVRTVENISMNQDSSQLEMHQCITFLYQVSVTPRDYKVPFIKECHRSPKNLRHIAHCKPPLRESKHHPIFLKLRHNRWLAWSCITRKLDLVTKISLGILPNFGWKVAWSCSQTAVHYTPCWNVYEFLIQKRRRERASLIIPYSEKMLNKKQSLLSFQPLLLVQEDLRLFTSPGISEITVISVYAMN